MSCCCLWQYYAIDLLCHAAVCGNIMQLTKSFRRGPRQQLLQGKGQPLQIERQQHPCGQMASISTMTNDMYESHIKWTDSHLFKQAKQLSPTSSGKTVFLSNKHSSRKQPTVTRHTCKLHTLHTEHKDGCLPAQCYQSPANGACYASWPFQPPLKGQTASSMGAWLPLWPCSGPSQQPLLLPVHSLAGPEHCTCCLACVLALLHHALRTAQPRPGQCAGLLSCLKAACKTPRPLARALATHLFTGARVLDIDKFQMVSVVHDGGIAC